MPQMRFVISHQNGTNFFRWSKAYARACVSLSRGSGVRIFVKPSRSGPATRGTPWQPTLRLLAKMQAWRRLMTARRIPRRHASSAASPKHKPAR